MGIVEKSEIEHPKMKDYIDLDVLQRIQDTFAQAMSVGAVTVDLKGNPVTRVSNFSKLCLLIRSTPEGLQRCKNCDALGGSKASQMRRPYPYICGGGLLDAAAPITIDGVFVGSILCGQVIPQDSQNDFIAEIIKHNITLGLDQKEVEQVANQIAPVPRERFTAAIEMLSITANYVIEKSVVNLAQAQLMRKEQERAALQVALKEAQLRAYKTQINPHFLFNSLTLLGYTALEEGAQHTEEIVYTLSDLLRYSLRNISTSVELGEEVEMVEQYLSIQKIGFGDRLGSRVDIEPELADFAVPCMVLQPLVENAVNHGAEPLSRRVIITVRAYRQDDVVILEVGDDGVGMPTAIAEKINRGIYDSEGESLGLQNVLHRLSAEFGEHFQARILTAPNQGTLIRLIIPRERPPEKSPNMTIPYPQSSLNQVNSHMDWNDIDFILPSDRHLYSLPNLFEGKTCGAKVGAAVENLGLNSSPIE